ncbi:hypothetical protein TNCV_218361, partial [Trichonephila clavipes]
MGVLHSGGGDKAVGVITGNGVDRVDTGVLHSGGDKMGVGG